MNISKLVAALPHFLRRHKLIKFLLYISPTSKIQLVYFNDCAKVYADISNIYYRNYFLTQSFHPYFFPIAKPFLIKGGVFFDVGANFGFCSFGMMGYLPHATINYHLFEANIDICKILFQSVNLCVNKEIIINNCCVSDFEGISKLKIVKEQLGESFISDEGEQEVKNLCLDQYIKRNHIEKVNFLKMDIEGWELFALKGAFTSLKNGVVDAIYLEISSQSLLRNAFLPSDCFTLLREAGFYLFYCKVSDLESSFLDKNKLITLYINGHSLKVAQLENFPSGYHTDILAIHKSFLKPHNFTVDESNNYFNPSK